MRAVIFSALIVSAMANASFAQQSPPDPQPPAPKAEDQLQPAPPPPPAGRDAANGPDAMWPHDRAGPPHGDRRGHWPPPPPPMKAAHFRIEDHGRKIDVKCADDEPTKVCADTLLQIMDKLGQSDGRSDDYRD